MSSPVILVTGAGKGIGRAIVEAIVARKSEFKNPKLFITSRTESELQSLKVLAEAQGLACETLVADLTAVSQSIVEKVVKKFSRLDLVFHAAGVGRFGHFLELSREDLQYTMATNVEASFLLMQAAYRQMKTQAQSSAVLYPGYRGDLVWISSIAAEKPFEHSSIYCMSKYAQKGLMDVMRLYARQDGIRVIDVKPGATLTPMWGEVDAETIPKMMSAEDVAQITLDAVLVHPRASVEEILLRPIHGDL